MGLLELNRYPLQMHSILRRLFGYAKHKARTVASSGLVRVVAFGKAFLSMPDLTERLRRGGPFQGLDKATMYGGGAAGYTDYPAL